MKMRLFEDEAGQTWGVPIDVIARSRATYFAEEDAHEEDDDTRKEIYEKELALALTNDEIIQDWATNNMDWDDVKGFAVLIRTSNKSPDADFWRAHHDKRLREINERWAEVLVRKPDRPLPICACCRGDGYNPRSGGGANCPECNGKGVNAPRKEN